MLDARTWRTGSELDSSTKSVLAGGCGEFPSNIASFIVVVKYSKNLSHVFQNPNKTSTVTWIVSFVIKVGLGIITFAYEL